MSILWTLEEFDAHDPERAQHLRQAPPWQELVGSVRNALRVALESNSARFGLDESGCDPSDLRGVVQFQIDKSLFDWFFNATTGYRAQFRIGRAHGLAMNAHLICELASEVTRFADADIALHRYTTDFIYKQSTSDKVCRVATTLDPGLSKVWACKKLIGCTGQIEQLFVSHTGPKLRMPEMGSWSSLYPEDAYAWLDVKGAFVPPAGRPYQLKSPEVRAATLEERGSA